MDSSNKKNSLLPSTVMDYGLFKERTQPLGLEPYLVIVSGFDKGKQFRLDKRQQVFGRGDDVDITINDPKISRCHGVLSCYPNRILLEDLQSTNGIFLQGERITRRWLQLQDRIHVGDSVMRIDYKHASEAEAEQALYRAAYTDALTGILNRGAFMQRAATELSFCKRNHALLTIAMCDVDYFKQKNDRYGHPAGDHILKELASILSNEVRQEDLLARYGGEEFIMLLRATPEAATLAFAERIRQAVMRHDFVFQEQSIPTTISIGFCTRQIEKDDSLESMIQTADAALYLAKQNGRNRVEIAPSPE